MPSRLLSRACANSSHFFFLFTTLQGLHTLYLIKPSGKIYLIAPPQKKQTLAPCEKASNQKMEKRGTKRHLFLVCPPLNLPLRSHAAASFPSLRMRTSWLCVCVCVILVVCGDTEVEWWTLVGFGRRPDPVSPPRHSRASSTHPASSDPVSSSSLSRLLRGFVTPDTTSQLSCVLLQVRLEWE